MQISRTCQARKCFLKARIKFMASKTALLQEEASILQEQMAIRDSIPPPGPHHNIITWWMLTFLTRSKACFHFSYSGRS